MSVRVRESGPLFDGRVNDAIKAYQDDVEREIGIHTVNEIQNELGRVLKNPTGYYKNHVQTDLQSNDVAVTDGGVIYGPWLEGVSSRNKRTRFKGYATFRRITQRVQNEVGVIGERVLSKYVGRMQ